MATSIQAQADLIKEASECDYIRFTIADMNAIGRGKTVPRRNLSIAAKDGVGIYGGILGMGPMGEIRFYKEINDLGNASCLLIPEPNTFHLVPFDNTKAITGEVLCESHWYHDGTYQVASPRYIARQQLKRLDDMGLSIKSACELEFVVFEKDRKTPITSGKEACFVQNAFASAQPLIYDIEQRLFKAGVDLETLQTEYAPGQFELVMRPSFGIQGADNVFIAKSGIKEICQLKDYFATFLTKLGPDVGNGLHFNYSLYKEDKNVLYDPSKPYNLSELAQHWLGGLIHHARAITVLHSSTVNCYRRVGTPWAAIRADWGIQNRMSTIRVKNKDENGTYFENRMSGGLGNPYLIMAANVAAGLDGIKNKMALPKENDENAVKLPATLEEGIKALEEDKVICDALGDQFVRWFKEMKEECEIKLVDVNIPNTEDAFKKEKALYMPYM